MTTAPQDRKPDWAPASRRTVVVNTCPACGGKDWTGIARRRGWPKWFNYFMCGCGQNIGVEIEN